MCGCKTNSTITSNNNMEDGYYYGNTGTFYERHVFLKKHDSTVIVDCFAKEHTTYILFSDTLINGKTNDSNFEGRLSKITYERKHYYIEQKSKTSLLQFKRIKFYLNLPKSVKWDIFKNRAYAQKGFNEFFHNQIKGSDQYKLYADLEKKYKIEEKISELKHQDFILEFEKLKQEMNEGTLK